MLYKILSISYAENKSQKEYEEIMQRLNEIYAKYSEFQNFIAKTIVETTMNAPEPYQLEEKILKEVIERMNR